MLSRILYLVLPLLLAGCDTYVGPIGGDSPEHLARMYEQYHQTKDMKNMLRLYNTEGVTEEIIQVEKRRFEKSFGRQLKSVTTERFNAEALAFFNREIQIQGQIIAYNLYVEGQVEAFTEGNYAMTSLYGKKDGRFYFALQTNRPASP